MQELCSLANTGTNITIIIAAAFGFITLASLILYQLKTGKAFSRGLFSLLLMFGLLGTVVLAPLSAHAAGSDAATNCPTGSQTSNNSGGGSQASITCPENWIVVPGNSAYNTNDFCVMKYNAKQVGATITDSYELTLYTDGSYSTDGTWSIVISGPINVTVGPFPYDVDGQTVADALEAAVEKVYRPITLAELRITMKPLLPGPRLTMTGTLRLISMTSSKMTALASTMLKFLPVILYLPAESPPAKLPVRHGLVSLRPTRLMPLRLPLPVLT